MENQKYENSNKQNNTHQINEHHQIEKNNRSVIAIIILLLVFGIIGVTLAYFSSQQTYSNVFKTKPYSTEFTENFTSPDNWVPGTTTPKTVTVKNTGEVEVAVRVSYTEGWTSANGATLDGLQGDQKAAIINLSNTDDWKYDNGYYYYNKTLLANESTNSFIESVTFNENIEADFTCTEQDGSKVCTSTGNGYDGATYKLTIKVETIQADAYKTAWNTNVVITNS